MDRKFEGELGERLQALVDYSDEYLHIYKTQPNGDLDYTPPFVSDETETLLCEFQEELDSTRQSYWERFKQCLS